MIFDSFSQSVQPFSKADLTTVHHPARFNYIMTSSGACTMGHIKGFKSAKNYNKCCYKVVYDS